jgi:hypothetical protein
MQSLNNTSIVNAGDRSHLTLLEDPRKDKSTTSKDRNQISKNGDEATGPAVGDGAINIVEEDDVLRFVR